MSTRPAVLASVAGGRANSAAQSPRLTQWSAAAACGIALVALAGWVLNLRLLAGEWETYPPMARSTGLALLLLGAALLARTGWSSRRRGRYLALAGASVAALLGLLTLAEFVWGCSWSVDWALARTSEMVGLVPVGRMSPWTGATLLLESGALVLALDVVRSRVASALALVFAALATLIQLVVLAGYLYGAPLLYGGSVVPVTAPAALALVLLGLGQIHLLLPRVAALRAWQTDTMRGILVRAFLPAFVLYVVLDAWADTWSGGVFESTNPALWHALVALAVGGLFVPIAAWVVRRTGDEVDSAQTALRASESRFRTYIEHAPDGVFVITAAGFYQDVNAAACSLLAYSRDELLHMHISQVLGGATTGDAQASLEALRRDGRYDGEFTFVRKDGSEFVGLLSATTINENQFLGLVKDITDRKRAEEALRQSEARSRALIDEASDGIFVTDRQGRFVEVNPAGCALLRRTASDILELALTDVVVTKQETPLRLSNLLNGETILGEREVYRKDGTLVPVEISARQLPDGRLQGIVRDITARKRADEDKSKLESQLRQAQKMEAVGRLAGGVAHDFNNMLGVILGHAELAAEQVGPAQPLYADLEEIRKAAVRSAALTRQLLAFARKQTVLRRVLDLNDTVAGMLTMLNRLIGEDIDLQWQPGADLWPVNMDPSQIDQILANLCINARDAITGVGTLTIGTGNSILDESYVAAHPGCAPGQYVRLSVGDNGCGMDKDTLTQIFEPFFTTKAVGEGTGLGLATVYGAVKQNDGFIDVVSEPGQGTTFTIYLPRHAVAASEGETEGAAKPLLGGHETILLVEDEPSVLRLSTRMLEHQGYTVLAAGRPEDALGLAHQHTGEIDLLITDVIMPEMNGRTLAKNLLAFNPRLKCLFMSGYTADVIAHHGVLDEGTQFLQKPFSTEELATSVRDALDGRN